MTRRSFSSLAGLVLSLSLAACGGGSSGGNNNFVIPPTNIGTITIAPAALTFSGPGAAPQTFTVSSSLGALPAPPIDPVGCGSVVTITANSSTLPATYTVNPVGNGTCSFVANVGHQAAALGIQVGSAASPPSLNQSTNGITLFIGGGAGTVTVSASSGTLIPDTTACAGIASITGGGASPQTFTITPLSAGSCTLVVVDGNSSVLVPITVNGGGSSNALFLSPSALTFASPTAASQTSTLSSTGNVGPVSWNEDDCIGKTGRAKIAFFTIDNLPQGQTTPLPATIRVTPYGPGFGSGTCQIIFTPQTGSSAVLTVTVNP